MRKKSRKKEKWTDLQNEYLLEFNEKLINKLLFIVAFLPNVKFS